MRHQSVTHHSAAARQKAERLRRKTSLDQRLRKHRRNHRRLARGLDNNRVARHQSRHRHPAKDRQCEVPRRNHDPHTQRQIPHLIAFAGQLNHALRPRQTRHLPRIILAEVDGLSHFRFRLRPRLPCLENQPGIELESALANQFRSAQQSANTRLRWCLAPDRKVPISRLDSLLRQLRSGLLMHPNDFRRARRIHRNQLVRRLHALAANQQRILAAQLRPNSPCASSMRRRFSAIEKSV